MLEIGANLPLQGAEFVHSLELRRVDEPDRDKDEVLVLVGQEPLNREQRVNAKAAV